MPATITGGQNGTVGLINTLTAQNSTAGTSIDFTGIPSGVRRVTVMLRGVSVSGISSLQIQIGSGSFTTSGYLSAGANVGSGGSPDVSNSTSGFVLSSQNLSTTVMHGNVVICNQSGNVWTSSGILARSDAAAILWSAGSVSLSGVLDRVRITTVNGTDTFDAGSINVLYE